MGDEGVTSVMERQGTTPPEEGRSLPPPPPVSARIGRRKGKGGRRKGKGGKGWEGKRGQYERKR